MKRTTTRRLAAAVVAAGLLAAGSAQASAAPSEDWSPEQQTVYATLVDSGVDDATATEIVTDPDRLAAVPVASGDDTTSGTNPAGAKGGSEAKIGSCSGKSNWAEREQWMRNVWGTKLLKIRLRTDFYYNGTSKVTCAYSSKTHTIHPTASAGGWYWDGSDFSEGYYTYNGKSLGGVKSEYSGYFRQCIAYKVGCFGQQTLIARTYVHYNGTWSTSGYTPGV